MGKKGKLREVEGDKGDWEDAETEEGQVAMVVSLFHQSVSL